MQTKTLSIFVLGAAALVGCGASSNSAPIVYGTQPASTGRIYNSPAEAYMMPDRAPTPYQGQAAYQGQVPYQAAGAQPVQQPYAANNYGQAPALREPAYAQPAALTPVEQATYSEIFTPTSNSAPTYVAANEANVTARTPWSQTAVAPQLVTARPGDTVYAISRRTGISAKAIIAENRMAPPYALTIGQTLRIPVAEQKVSNNFAPARSAPTIQPLQQAQPFQASVNASPLSAGAVHLVQPGDTLYSLSRKTGVSVAMLAQQNRLQPPYNLSVGDRLQLPSAASLPAAPYNAAPAVNSARNVSYNAPAKAQSLAPVSSFEWPVKGAVIGKYGTGDLGRRNDGVNIAAPVGTPVRAAAGGEVVYRGSELDGYGNLLLIKHDDGFVTAYAHNDVMLVRKGQKVRQGQVIAKVGQTGSASEPQLHFEIRQNLKSVDPLAFLQ